MYSGKICHLRAPAHRIRTDPWYLLTAVLVIAISTRCNLAVEEDPLDDVGAQAPILGNRSSSIRERPVKVVDSIFVECSSLDWSLVVL